MHGDHSGALPAAAGAARASATKGRRINVRIVRTSSRRLDDALIRHAGRGPGVSEDPRPAPGNYLARASASSPMRSLGPESAWIGASSAPRSSEVGSGWCNFAPSRRSSRSSPSGRGPVLMLRGGAGSVLSGSRSPCSPRCTPAPLAHGTRRIGAIQRNPSSLADGCLWAVRPISRPAPAPSGGEGWRKRTAQEAGGNHIYLGGRARLRRAEATCPPRPPADAAATG